MLRRAGSCKESAQMSLSMWQIERDVKAPTPAIMRCRLARFLTNPDSPESVVSKVKYCHVRPQRGGRMPLNRRDAWPTRFNEI